MFFNNALYLFLFYVLFEYFGTINGYNFADVALIQGIAMIAIGIVHVSFGGITRMIDSVFDGRIDLFLSQPLSVLAHIGMSRSAQDGWGDIALGLLAIIFFAPNHFLLAVVCALVGAVAFVALEILMNTLAFYLPRPKALVRGLRFSTIAMASWPMDLYPTAVRVVVYGLGIALVSTVPRNIVASFDWTTFAVFVALSFTLLWIATWVFRNALRRYESGNLVTMRG
jgi:ABC-2 type transport system permease protein